MTIPEGHLYRNRRIDNFVRNSGTGGLPVGSPEAKAAIDRVGRALHGEHWQPGGGVTHQKGWKVKPDALNE